MRKGAFNVIEKARYFLFNDIEEGREGEGRRRKEREGEGDGGRINAKGREETLDVIVDMPLICKAHKNVFGVKGTLPLKDLVIEEFASTSVC